MKKLSVIFSAVCAVLAFSSVFSSCGSTKVSASGNSLSDVWISSKKESVQDCGRFYTTPELGRYKSLEVEFKKDSGSEAACFGLVFGFSSQKDGICSDYIRFEINALGEYAVYSFDGKKYFDLVNEDASDTAYYSESGAINKGLGAQNKLKVEIASDDTYSCYINGSCVANGIKPLKNGTKGVMAFFSVGTAEEENLPETPVEVSYRVTGFKIK